MHCILSKLEASAKEEMDEEKRRVCEDCSFATTSHQRCKLRILSRLLSFLQENESKHDNLLQRVVIGNEGVPMFFLVFAGEPHPGKKASFNTIMKDWALSGGALRKVGELKEGEHLFLKPPALTVITRVFSKDEKQN